MFKLIELKLEVYMHNYIFCFVALVTGIICVTHIMIRVFVTFFFFFLMPMFSKYHVSKSDGSICIVVYSIKFVVYIVSKYFCIVRLRKRKRQTHRQRCACARV